MLGTRAPLIAGVTVPFAVGLVGALFALIVRPDLVQFALDRVPLPGRARIAPTLQRVAHAATAYRGQGGLIAAAGILSFLVHFLTAAMYFFTALAIGAMHARFWEVTFASSIQIFATVMSPFTIAGEGVREIVQTLLLARHIGASESIISAALGFWAAEALTLVGGIIYLWRAAAYRPAFVHASESLSSTAPPNPDEHATAPSRRW